MKKKSFEGTTRAEAEQLAESWVSTQSGIKVTSTHVTGAGVGTRWPPTPINLDMWTVVVEYEDGSN